MLHSRYQNAFRFWYLYFVFRKVIIFFIKTQEKSEDTLSTLTILHTIPHHLKCRHTGRFGAVGEGVRVKNVENYSMSNIRCLS